MKSRIALFPFGYLFSIAVVMLSGAGLTDDTPTWRSMLQPTLIELTGLAFVVWLFFRLRRNNAAMRLTGVSLPSGRLCLALFLLVPLLTVIQVSCLTWGEADFFSIDKDCTWHDAALMMLELPLVAVIGPAFEEFCYRILPVTPFRSSGGRIAAAIATCLLFAFMHVSRWHIVVWDSIVYTSVLLLTRNIWISVVLHIFHNLSTILLPIATLLLVSLFPRLETGIAGLPVAVVIVVAIMFCLGLRLIVKR